VIVNLEIDVVFFSILRSNFLSEALGFCHHFCEDCLDLFVVFVKLDGGLSRPNREFNTLATTALTAIRNTESIWELRALVHWGLARAGLCANKKFVVLPSR